jgi:hypothetical protein
MSKTRSLFALAAAACALAPAARAQGEFAPVKVPETVTYPLPPMPLPAAPKPPEGKWAETEDSPALRVSRAWVKLGEGAGIERSEGTRRLFQAWKAEVNKSGSGSRASQAAHATFLAAYKADLEKARIVYEGVLRDVEALDNEGAGSSGSEKSGPATSLAREAEEQIRAAERDERLTSSACHLSPETCQQPDETDRALQDEISRLVHDTLETGGPDGGLSFYALKRKAGLLALRARVMAAVTTRAAARLATEVATQTDGKGAPRALPSPVSSMTGSSSRRAGTPTSDPYQ